MDAFWSVVAKNFPEVKNGDISPSLKDSIDMRMTNAIFAWVMGNLPS